MRLMLAHSRLPECVSGYPWELRLQNLEACGAEVSYDASYVDRRASQHWFGRPQPTVESGG